MTHARQILLTALLVLPLLSLMLLTGCDKRHRISHGRAYYYGTQPHYSDRVVHIGVRSHPRPPARVVVHRGGHGSGYRKSPAPVVVRRKSPAPVVAHRKPAHPVVVRRSGGHDGKRRSAPAPVVVRRRDDDDDDRRGGRSGGRTRRR